MSRGPLPMLKQAPEVSRLRSIRTSRLFPTYIKSLLPAFILACSCSDALAQQDSVVSFRGSNSAAPISVTEESKPPVMPRTPARLLSDLLVAESRVREALNQHTFKRDVVLQ